MNIVGHYTVRKPAPVTAMEWITEKCKDMDWPGSFKPCIRVSEDNKGPHYTLIEDRDFVCPLQEGYFIVKDSFGGYEAMTSDAFHALYEEM